MKLFDSEMKVMELLWKNGELTAKELAERLAVEPGWSKTTTYTVLKKCVDKGAVERTDPGFRCRALVSLEEVQQAQTAELVDKLYGGKPDRLVASLLSGRKMTREEIDSLKQLIDQLE